ncbi:glycosyltransferase family 39 protein [Candidatus Woesearchaeota archaeon]|nr:glycosyltransferase family 39 protein [Candidatus Woesearchaeota archaeon]
MKQWLLFLILAVFFAVQIPSVLHQHPGWDESVYIGIGKYLFSEGTSGLYEPIRPLLLPAIMGATWTLGGGLVASRFLMLVIALIAIGLAWIVGNELGGEPAAFWSALILAAAPVFFGDATSVTTDLLAGLLILATAWQARKNILISGILAGLAFATKFPAGLALIFPLLASRMDARKIGAALAGFALIVLPYLAANAVLEGDPFEPLLLASRHAGNRAYAVPGLLQNLSFYPLALLGASPLLVFALLGLASTRRRALQFGTLVVIAYFVLIDNKQPRFALLFLPLLAVFAGAGIVYCREHAKRTATILLIAGLAITIINDAPLANDFGERPDIEGFEVAARYGTVLTADPRFSAYHDNRALPMYYLPFDVMNATTAYDLGAPIAGAAIFREDSFACEKFKAEWCSALVDSLKSRLEKHPIAHMDGVVVYQLTGEIPASATKGI